MTSPTSRRLEIEFVGNTEDVQRAVRRVQGVVRRAVKGLESLEATIDVDANVKPAQAKVAAWRKQQERNAINVKVRADLRNIRAVSTAVLQLTRGINLVGLVAGGLGAVTFLIGAATAITAMATSLGFALVSLTAMLPAAIGLATAFTAVSLAADAIKDSEGWQRLKSDIDELKEIAAAEMVPAFNEFYRQAERNFPILRDHIQNLAREIGSALEDVGEFLGGDLAGEQLTNIFGFNEGAIAALGRAVRPLTGIILSLSEAAAPQFERFALAVERALDKFDAFLLRKRETGELADFFEEAGDEMAKWGRIFRNIFTGLGNLIKGAIEPSREWASAFERITENFREWSRLEQTQQSVRRFFEFMRDLPYGDILQVVAAITVMVIAFKGVQGIVTVVQGFAGAISAIAAAGPILGPVLGVLAAIAVAIGLVAGAFVIAYTESSKFREIANAAVVGLFDRLSELKDQVSDVFGVLREQWTRWADSDAGRDALRDLRTSFSGAKDAANDLWNTVFDKIEQFKEQLQDAESLVGRAFGALTGTLSDIADGFSQVTDAISLLVTSLNPAESKFSIAAIAASLFTAELQKISLIIKIVLGALALWITSLALTALAAQEAAEWIAYFGRVLSNPLRSGSVEPPWRNGWLTGLDELKEKAKELSEVEIPTLNQALASTEEAGAGGAAGLENFANSGTNVKTKVDELREAYKQAFGEDIPQSVADGLTQIEERATAHEAFLNEVFKYERVKQGVADLRKAIEEAGLEIAPEWEQAFREIESAADTAKNNVNESFTQMQSGSREAQEGIRLDAGQTRQQIERDMASVRQASENSASGSSRAWRGGGGAFGEINAGADGMRRSVGASFNSMQTNAISAATNAAKGVVAKLSGIRLTAPSMSFQNIVNAASAAASSVRAILSGLGGFFLGRALGGMVAPPAWAKRAALGASNAGAFWVGEHGRELFVPTQPGRIINHSRSEKMARESGGIQVNVILTGLPQAFAEFVDVRVTQGHRDQRRFEDSGSSIGGW